MADNESQINRRRNPYLSFYLKALFALLILLDLHVVVLHVSATNQCTEFQFKVLNDAQGTSLCVDCESCPPGQGLSHECGTEILSSEMVHCIPCIQGSSFSNNYDTLSCIQCSASCSEDQLVNQTCTTTSDVKCAKQCNSKDRYYDELTGDCQKCSKCCGDSQDLIEDECKKMGAASKMICSIHSSVNQCDITLTPSRQKTLTSQNGANTKASPQETIGSQNVSTAASLENTRESQKDVPRESSEVSTTFWSNISHQNTGTVASFGERSFEGSSEALQDADNQVGVVVVSTVAVVLGLLLLALGYVLYYRSSRSRSCSMHASSDAEKGEYRPVICTAACVTADKGDNRGRKDLKIKWKKSKSESCDPLFGKNSEELKCACQIATQKESKLLKSLLSQESTLQTLCEMLDTDVPLLGDYKAVAQYYGINHYQISSVLGQATYPGEPTRTRALIVSLSCSRPDETVEEFATVVDKEAKRSDVSLLLRDYDMAE